MENISKTLNNLPQNSGVYIFKDVTEYVLYIGKAVNIKDRVSSYFNSDRDIRFQLPRLVEKIEKIEFIICSNEVEALVLEANLVRRHQPPYNILLKDDKHYPYVKITKSSEEFPRILIVRKISGDDDVYFGPFTDTTMLRFVVSSLKKILKIRNCNMNITSEKTSRPCIDFSMNLCRAPCNQSICREDYFMLIEQAIRFFRGQQKDIIYYIESKMGEFSQVMEYEKAAYMRDILFGIKKLALKQNIDLRNLSLNCDVFAVFEQSKYICFTIMNVRRGNLINQNNRIIPINGWNYDGRAKLIADYYATSANDVPKNIVLSSEFAQDADLIGDFISQKYKSRVFVSKGGYAAKLVKLAEKNCNVYLAQQYINNPAEILEELANVCNLPKIPHTIEAFDISNVGDKFCVAGMVHFYGLNPDKSNYRRFKIKYVEGQNDFAMMNEAIKRRLNQLIDDKKSFPDLLLIDGGKGQLSAAQKAIQEFDNPPMLISLAKKQEIIISPYRDDEIRFDESHPVRRLMERIRDEVHRFAVTYHRKIRGRQFSRTILQDIKGIGGKKSEILLKKFGSIQEISKKTIEELSGVKGITQNDAQRILSEIKSII
ncbi:MAG: excinuclease ABC subunit UvrC [Chitinispirillales bacterium]|jgi:excinuclease ABC subunit C|nr:excinuclease ABC subunit UvrC [Chitinispirillales bacterium]